MKGFRSLSLVRVSLFIVFTLSFLVIEGCLYLYHNYEFKPEYLQEEELRIEIGASLYVTQGTGWTKVDGEIADSANSWWSLSWHGNVDSTLRPYCRIFSDSITIESSELQSPLTCNVRQEMTARHWGGRWAEWNCGRLQFSQLQATHITVRLIISIEDLSGKLLKQHEVIWQGKRDKKRIHSDY